MTTTSTDACVEMPRYKSHKEVWALKIDAVTPLSDGTAELSFDDDRYANIKVDADYVGKHDPQAGGYYVVYEDGYKSWSPAEAFESGYKLIAGDDDKPFDIRDNDELWVAFQALKPKLAACMIGADDYTVRIATKSGERLALELPAYVSADPEAATELDRSVNTDRVRNPMTVITHAFR